jgi:thiamine pyrophosphate-dependent acetolactate synthase large subunit-like protein
MAKKKIADWLVEVLAEAGVREIYGVAGDSLSGITASNRAKKQIQWIQVRHEETAAFAAGAEAHLTGRLAVCTGSCGPGNLYLVNGLYDCHRSRVPVLAIAAQIPSNEIGSGYFQETTRNTSSRSAATIVNWFLNPSRCPCPRDCHANCNLQARCCRRGHSWLLWSWKWKPRASSILEQTCRTQASQGMAEAVGLLGLTAETSDQVEPVIAQALQHDGPALVEVIVSRHELSMPPTITLDQAKGFSLFMLRAVISGRGNEIINLAKVDLLR